MDSSKYYDEEQYKGSGKEIKRYETKIQARRKAS